MDYVQEGERPQGALSQDHSRFVQLHLQQNGRILRVVQVRRERSVPEELSVDTHLAVVAFLNHLNVLV